MSGRAGRSARTVAVAMLVGAAIGVVVALVARVPAPSVATTTFSVRGAPSAAELDRAASILQARLRAFDDPSATVTAKPGRLILVERRPAGSDAAPEGWPVLADPLRFEVRPVLGSIAAGDPGWSTTPVTACQYSTGREGCAEGIHSVCPYGEDGGACSPDVVAGKDAVFLGTDSAIYRLGPAFLTNDEVRTADTFVNGPAASVIQVKLTPEGASRLLDETTARPGEQLAIVLDQGVISAPSVVVPIDSGRLQIVELPSGNEELRAQVTGLRTGPLPVLLRAGETSVEHRRTVSTTRLLVFAAVGAALGAAVGFLLGRRRRRP